MFKMCFNETTPLNEVALASNKATCLSGMLTLTDPEIAPGSALKWFC